MTDQEPRGIQSLTYSRDPAIGFSRGDIAVLSCRLVASWCVLQLVHVIGLVGWAIQVGSSSSQQQAQIWIAASPYVGYAIIGFLLWIFSVPIAPFMLPNLESNTLKESATVRDFQGIAFCVTGAVLVAFGVPQLVLVLARQRWGPSESVFRSVNWKDFVEPMFMIAFGACMFLGRSGLTNLRLRLLQPNPIAESGPPSEQQ